jgi:hypothetical protein
MIGKNNMRRVMGRHHLNNGGFTLIEALTAAGMIAIVLMMTTTMLMVFFRGQRDTKEMLKMNDQVRYIVSLIAERTTDGRIDYAFYDGAPSAQSDMLAVRDSQGKQTVFWLKEENGIRNMWLCEIEQTESECNPTAVDDWLQINSSEVVFSVGRFVIAPDVSPYAELNTAQLPTTHEMPRVSMIMKMKKREGDQHTSLIQTAITPRYYAR